MAKKESMETEKYTKRFNMSEFANRELHEWQILSMLRNLRFLAHEETEFPVPRKTVVFLRASEMLGISQCAQEPLVTRHAISL